MNSSLNSARSSQQLELLEAAAETEAATRSLHEFVRAAWHVVEPGRPLRDGWHLAAICEHLQAVTEGDIKELLINVPPRMTKSLTTSVFWPAWEWARDPSVRWLFTSYRLDLSIRDNVRARRLVESPWYQARWPQVRLERDQNQKTRYETTQAGYRIAVSFGGGATGDGGQRRVVDDPHNAQDVHSDVKREGDLDWWRNVWTTRHIDPSTDADVVIMQRLHERDLSGYLLEEIGTYTHLMLPMRFELERRCTTSLGWTDPRHDEGELLDPQRFPEDAVAGLELRLGSFGAAGQLQQRPAPSGGGIIKEHHFRYWVTPDYAHLPPVQLKGESGEILTIPHTTRPLDPDMDQWLQSWDMSFKATQDSSRVAGQVWATKGADAFLIENRAHPLTFTQTVDAVRAMTRDYPLAYRKLVEDKANGPAVINTLEQELGGFTPVEPFGSKTARMHAVTPRVEAGNVYLPHPGLPGYTWVTGLRARLALFPAGSYNDEGDCFSQALNALPRSATPYAATQQPKRSSRVMNPRRH